MTQGRKISDELVEKWVDTLPSLQKKYPPMLSGFENSYNHASCILARKHNLHPRTVYIRIKNELKSRMARGGYASKHELLRRHIANVLCEVYKNDFELPKSEIIHRITEYSGIKIRESSLETMLKRHNNHPEGKPLIESEPDKYVLNGNFYASQKKHPKYRKKALNTIQA